MIKSHCRVPTPVAIILSAAVFALAHLTPGEFPQLFVLGSALGISYAQTRNLLTPITIHAFWNSGVILFLTFLQVYCLHYARVPNYHRHIRLKVCPVSNMCKVPTRH